ncbi:unnamed protein product [Leptosia nina]|uniref:Uncharacterized protein n=1 Tax=Leptosia nina TaxID=320188 RepID=A0AAV1IWF5_9NEOP
MTQVLLQHSCNWYNQLHPTLNLLQVKGLNFLPSGYELAEDLEVWCDLKNLDNFGRFEWSSKIKIDIDPNTVEDDEGSLGENILDYVNNLNEEEEILEEHDRVKSNLPAKSEYSLSNAIDDDIGVAISRNSLKLSDPLQYKTKLYEKKEDLKSTNLSDNKQLLRHCDLKKSNTNNYIHSIERIISNKDLKQFIDTEETFRNESRDKALTGHLSFMQWHTLKSCLLTFLNSDILPRKFHRRILKIWNDKCLYYK